MRIEFNGIVIQVVQDPKSKEERVRMTNSYSKDKLDLNVGEVWIVANLLMMVADKGKHSD